MNLLCTALKIWCATVPAPAVVPATDAPRVEFVKEYTPLDHVPAYITDEAHCTTNRLWRFGTDVIVAKTADGVIHIRPKHVEDRNANSFLLYIDGDGCKISGKVLDVQWPGDGEVTVEFKEAVPHL